MNSRIFPFTLLVLCAAFSASVEAADYPPPLKITAQVKVEVRNSARSSQPIISNGSVLTIYSSNSWWRIRMVPEELSTPQASRQRAVLDCMKIPDGIRYYAEPFSQFKTSNERTLAHALPSLTPPAGNWELIVAWLAFCPRPNLPISEGRFLTNFLTPSPDPTANRLMPCSIVYSESDKVFLSSLLVTNTGEPDFRYAWPEFTFKVSQTTNFHGFAIPTEAAFVRTTPESPGRSASDVYPVVTISIRLTAAELLADDTSPALWKPQLVAQDERLGIPASQQFHYRVVDDKWDSPTNPALKKFSANVREIEKEKGVRP